MREQNEIALIRNGQVFFCALFDAVNYWKRIPGIYNYAQRIPGSITVRRRTFQTSV